MASVSTGFTAAKPSWDPIPPADLAATDSPSHPGIGVEILFARETIEENGFGLEADNYVRAKLYTPGGIARSDLLRIQHADWLKISGLAARVVKPDGTSTELTKAAFRETTAAKVQGQRELREIALAFPNLAPGDIVEYRWHERADQWITFWKYCQGEIPVREFKLVMKASNAAVISWQNCPQAQPSGKGTDEPSVTIRDLPAFVSEPYMPPERDLRGWVRLTYNLADDTVEEGWKKEGETWTRYFNDHTKPNAALNKKAAELTAGAKSDDEKLERIYRYCQTQILSYTWQDSPELLAERKKRSGRSFQTARETLERGKGMGGEIDYLFAGLVRAAGFEAREARSAGRNEMLNTRMRGGWTYMDHSTVAVKIAGQWRFYSPASFAIPYGMNHRHEESTVAYVCAGKQSQFALIPATPADRTIHGRKARLRLDAEGTLEGEIEETFTGHAAEQEKELHWDDSPTELEQAARGAVTDRLANAEISDIRWENLRAPELPVLRRYKVQVPGYAQKVGSRLAWMPNYFGAGTTTLFPSTERRHPVLMPYAWTERDDIEIVLPEGFELDRPSAPANVRSAADPVHATFKLLYHGKRRTLAYQRECVISQVGYDVDQYPWVKQTFDDLNRSTTHTLVLKPKTASAGPAPAAAPKAGAPGVVAR